MERKTSRKAVLTDEQSKLNARLEAHMVYICPECGKAFRTQAEWRQHLNLRHDYLKKTYTDFHFIQIDERFHECQLCFKWVENAQETIALLQYHYFMHLDHRETYRCVHCRMAYTRRRALNVHLMDNHLAEIEQYEAKVRQSKRLKDQQRQAEAEQAKRKDLLQKALMDIDLQSELPSPTHKPKSKPKVNASELALDRSLNAYEDIVRKEEKKPLPSIQPYDAELEALCQEFFEEVPTSSTTEDDNKNDKELVIIEIDALDEDEVKQLKKEMNSDTDTPPSKRRRLSVTPDRDNSSEVTQGMMKFITFLCPKCGKEIHNMEEWRTHVFKTHNFEHYFEKTFKTIESGRKSKCLECNEILHTTKSVDLQKHCFKHLPYRSYLKCVLCERTKTSTSKMFNHIKYNHQEELQLKNNTQLLIKSEPKTYSPKQRHLPVFESTDTQAELECNNCLKVFKQAARLQRHISMCRTVSVDKATDLLLNHLREGRLRMDGIWSYMIKTNKNVCSH